MQRTQGNKQSFVHYVAIRREIDLSNYRLNRSTLLL